MRNWFHKEVEDFLIANGFRNVGTDYLENDHVRIFCWNEKEPAHYEIYDKRVDGSIHSCDLNIYWLIGYLTWNGYMPMTYKKI